MCIRDSYWFFGTEIGSALRATGNNEDMIRALGVNTKLTKLLALMLSNGLVGMSGAQMCIRDSPQCGRDRVPGAGVGF